MGKRIKEPHWTDGLSTAAANAIYREFESKEDLIRAFDEGRIKIKQIGGGSTVYGLGSKGMAEVRAWLGLPPAGSESATIRKHIAYLEKHGYIVKKIG